MDGNGKYGAEVAATFRAQYSNSLPLYLLHYNKHAIEWASHTAHLRSWVKKIFCSSKKSFFFTIELLPVNRKLTGLFICSRSG